MEKFRDTIKSAILESVSLLLNDEQRDSNTEGLIALLICEYSGYVDFIGYKFGYPPNDHLFDTRVSTCEPFGFLSGQRVLTIDGDAICIGVAPSTVDNSTELELYFDLIDRNTKIWKRLCYPTFKKEEFVKKNFVLLDGFVNVWGQDWHSFSSSFPSFKKWWNDEKYLIGNPLNMRTELPPLPSVAPIPTGADNVSYDESLWFWSTSSMNLSQVTQYNKDLCEKIEKLDIGRSFIFENYDSMRAYLIIKTADDSGYQLNVESRFVRRILKGSAVQRMQNEDATKAITSHTNLSWFWEGDEANLNVWNKYDEDMCSLINNHTLSQYGSAIPYSYVRQEHKFKYEIVRLSEKEGIQRNIYTDFSRRIVREDHDDIDVDGMMSSEEYGAKLKQELLPSDDDNEEKYEFKDELQPTSNIATLATESSVPLTPKTEEKEKEYIKIQTEKQYKAQKQAQLIVPHPDKSEDVVVKVKKKREWRWIKAMMYTGYVFARCLSLTDLCTDLYLLYKAQDSGVILLTIALFISIFSPYVLSYSSGIKLFIFRKTFDHLQGFKKIFLLLYLLPSGFLYFIFIDLIDSLFTVYKWFLYNVLCRNEKTIKETEELLAQQLGMDRMNWEGFKRQKTVGQLMFETIPQVILQGLIAFNVGGKALVLSGTTILKRDLYISIGSATINSIGQITKLYLESTAVQESFIQYALTCMMGRVGWVPFRHKIQRIFTNKNINISEKQNADNTVLNISSGNLSEDTQQNIVPKAPLSDIEEISFNIKYNIPIFTNLLRHFGFKGKHKLQGTIEYDFSTVTIRYLIATLLVLQNTKSEDPKHQKNNSIKIIFGQSLRLLGVHDISLLLETCRKKNISLENVKEMVKWDRAFEISTINDRKDPRLISYSRDEQGRPLLIGLYLSGYDPDKHIFRELLRNDVPTNLEDASGETIVYHLIRHMDYAAIRELFKTKYEKDEKRSNIYLNIYNRSGYSPLYLALHQHIREIAQREIEKVDETEDDVDAIQDEKDENDEGEFVIDEPPAKAPKAVKVTFKTDTDQVQEEKMEEDPQNMVEMAPITKEVAGETVDTKTDETLVEESEIPVENPETAPLITPIESVPVTDTKQAPMAPMAPSKTNQAPMAPMAPMVKGTPSKTDIINEMKPLSMIESIRVQKYTRMWNQGQPQEAIEAEMESNDVPISLLQRYIRNKKGKGSKKRKKKKKQLATSNVLSRKQSANIKRTLEKKLKKPAAPIYPIRKQISDGESTVVTMKKQIQEREARQRRKEQRKQKKQAQKQKNISYSLEEHLVEMAKTDRFAADTIINCLRFKLQDALWNNLMTLFEHQEMIRCVYDCIAASSAMLISTKCQFLNDYTKMAKLGTTLVQIEEKMKKDKYLIQQQRHAFVKAYKLLDNIENDLIHRFDSLDAKIAYKMKETLKKKRRNNKYEIFKIIPIIMDAQHMMKLNHRENTLKQFIAKGSMQLHAVMDYIKAFEQHCDINKLKLALNLKLSAAEFQEFAPLTGSYKEYLFQQQQEDQTLAELMKIIQEKEMEKIEAKLVSFSYDHLRGYYLDYFSDQKDKKQSADISEDDEYEVDLFGDRQWMYQILLSNNSDPNFQCNSGGLSPLAYALTNLFEHIYVANDLVSRGAKLQAQEKHIMVNIFVHSAFQHKAELYLDICMRICRKSDIHLSNIRDQNGNNPMHLAVLRTDDNVKKRAKKEKKKQINHKFIRQKQKALQLLNERHSKWLKQKNNNDMYPLTIAVKFRDLDSTMCLGAISASSLQKYMKSIVSHREFVMDLIIWVVTVLLTAHGSGKWSDANYDKLMEVELLFSVFQYNVSFVWPSSYIKSNEIIHFDEFQKDTLDLKSFSLISYCYDKRLYSVLELLTTEFNIMRYLSANEHLKVKEMQFEIKQFTGQMFQESKKKFETRWKENILDKIKQDMLLENDFSTPDITDVASKFASGGEDIYGDDDDDIDDEEYKEKKKPVSWIEVLYSTTVEGLSTVDFITDIFILRDLWRSEGNLWWTTFMLSLLIAPYLVCYSALGSLIQHRMNFIYLTMSLDDGKSVKCSRKCKWASFKLLVLLLMTPLCIAYFVIIDIVFMIYVMFATLVFFISCTRWQINDLMDDWVFKKIFGLNRMQIIGYRRLRTLSQLFFETIPQIFLQLRILWQIEWAKKENDFEINSETIMWSVFFAVLHLIFEAAIISLDSAASKMKFIHYAIVCLGARLDWIPFSHLFGKKAREIQDVIDKKDYKQRIDIKQQYFESENEDIQQQLMDNKHEPFNYEEISAGLLGLRYKLEFQFSNESMNKLAETLTYLPSPTLPTNHTSNRLLKSLLNSVLLEPLMMEVIIGAESCRNVDIFSVAELYRSTVHRVHLNITEIDMYRVIQNSHISNNSDRNKRKMLSLLMEEFINYGELFVVEWLSQKHLGLNKEAQSIKSWIILNSLGGVNGIQLTGDDAINSNIEGGKFEILRKYYTEGLVFGLECKLAKVIYKYIYQCLQRAQQENTYFYVAVFILWYTRCNIYNHCCSLGCCRIRNQLQSIQSHEAMVSISPKGSGKDMTRSSSMKYFNMGLDSANYVDSLLDKLHKYLPQILEIGSWEMSFQLTECFAIFKVHLEELLLNQLKNSTNSKHPQQFQQNEVKKKKKMKNKRAMMWRVATTKDFEKTASHFLNINDEYTQRVLGLDFYKLAERIHQSDIDLLQAIIDTPIGKLHAFPLHSWFVNKLEALDVLVTELRMIYQYNKYIVCSKKYRNKDVCFMGENGKIVNDLHLTNSMGIKSIYISMAELRNFLPVMHLGISRLRFRFKNLQSKEMGALDDEKKSEEDNVNKKDVGHIKLWWINPIEASDKKLSTNASAKRRITDTLEWNRVYLKNAPITYKIVNDAYFDVSISGVLGLSMYNRRLIDYDKIAPLYLELSVKYGHNLHCDGMELEVEFIKKGMRKISVTEEERPIHQFCKNNSLKLLKYMVPTYTANRTFDINARTKGAKETPLHIACRKNVINYEIVELLIHNGVEINKQNKDKDTALDIMQKNKNKNPNISDANHNVEQLLIKNKAVFNTQKPKKTNDPRLKEYLNMLKIGVPIWAVIQFMRKRGADRGLIEDIERMQIQSEEQKQIK